MKCKALNKDGQPCQGQAMANGYCYRHNPDISDAEKREASGRGGSKPRKEQLAKQAETAGVVKINALTDILDVLNTNINDVRSGNIDPKVSNAVVQNVNAILKTYELAVLESRVRGLEEKAGIESPTKLETVGGN